MIYFWAPSRWKRDEEQITQISQWQIISNHSSSFQGPNKEVLRMRWSRDVIHPDFIRLCPNVLQDILTGQLGKQEPSGYKLVGKPYTKSSCRWCSIALEVGYWIDLYWGQQYSLFSSMTGKMKERACLLNSDLLPSFQNAGRHGESLKWSWQVGAEVWTDGKGNNWGSKM